MYNELPEDFDLGLGAEYIVKFLPGLKFKPS